MPRRVLISVGLSLCASLVSACQGGVEHPSDPAEAYQEVASTSAGEGTRRVATVDGRPVTNELVERIWGETPDEEAEAVQQRAIAREAAASHLLANRRLIDGDLLSFARKRGMVRALLEREVESSVTRQSLESDAIDERVAKLKRKAGRPEGVEASHLLVKTKRDEGDGGGDVGQGSVQHDDRKERARRIATEARAWLIDKASGGEGTGSVTVEQLFGARRKFAEDTEFPLVVNAHIRFAMPGAPDWKTPQGWAQVVSPFREAAGELARKGAFFEVSEPIETTFGWHLIVVENTFARKAPQTEPLRALAERQLLRERRKKVYERHIDRWMGQTTYESYPAALRSEPAGSRK